MASGALYVIGARLLTRLNCCLLSPVARRAPEMATESLEVNEAAPLKSQESAQALRGAAKSRPARVDSAL